MWCAVLCCAVHMYVCVYVCMLSNRCTRNRTPPVLRCSVWRDKIGLANPSSRGRWMRPGGLVYACVEIDDNVDGCD
ncbi:hypothetical protein F5Y00DRAFT_214074 [Daldinia vernicosa]|uniref:uncharacterized protein n=1 Tax=Daldinia vernicosa TaxID=114800 RepID=UPI002007C428|nr:uncharacterized protein F5Y00DRAFT_214074 [Daldinia vernicosa]KAI0851644.1 hypothetical protein F5Y00DRAFT_214074 [Daldinia vernicosa]